MDTKCRVRETMQGHPCFGGNHHKNGRIHLPVAPRCNIQCKFCTRRHDCVNESRPGVTSRILSPDQALSRLREVFADPLLGPTIKVVGIAGPGDPLANEQTFETLRRVGLEFPQLIRCLSTNGLRLPDTVERLHALPLDLRSLTITVNAIDPQVGAEIYSWVYYGGKRHVGRDGAEILIANQLIGLERAAGYGITVKVNTVLIPGVNDAEILRIAEEVKLRGASIMNVMPLIPQAEFVALPAPTVELLEEVRSANEAIIKQFRHCRQCRADAVGLIGSQLPVI